MTSRRGHNEGSLYRRPDGIWTGALSVGYVGGKRQRRKVYGKTRAEAASALAKAIREQEQGLPVAGGRQTVGAFLQGWLRDSAAQRLRPRSYERYANIVEGHIIPAIGRVSLARLTPADVNAMMADGLKADGLKAAASARSVNHWRAVLRTALAAAMRYGLIGRNVAALADPPRVAQKEVRPLSVDDAKAILAATADDRLSGLFSVSLSLGLRQGEALGLRWGDIDLDGGALSVQRSLQRVDGEWLFLEPKTVKSRRTIPLPRAVAGALTAHRARQNAERLLAGPNWQDDDLVFCDELGRPLSGFTVLRVLRKLLRAAGLPPMKFHELRHGAASLMAAQGVPARTAMELLGHANISTTLNIYTHITPESTRDAIEKVGAALWGQS